MALRGDTELWVASTRGNNVQRIDLTRAKSRKWCRSASPRSHRFRGPEHAFVSNWGGDPPSQTIQQHRPPRRRSDRPRNSVANQAPSRSCLVDGQWKQRKTDPGRSASQRHDREQDRQFLYVANANSDTVSVIDTARQAVIETIVCRPEDRLPFGSGCNALALSPDGASSTSPTAPTTVSPSSPGCDVVRSRAANARHNQRLARPDSDGLVSRRASAFLRRWQETLRRQYQGHGSLAEPRARK